MLRSCLCFFALASLAACTATPTTIDLSSSSGGEPPPTIGTPPPSSTTPPSTTPPPEKVTFAYSTVPLPASSLSIESIGGSSSSDVWIVASEAGATSSTPWTAYHYDGAKWTSMTLSATKGRPNFGVVSLGGDDVYLGFSYPGDIFKLSGGTFTKKTSFSVTSGYTMAAVGTKVFVGTQENFGAGPLYVVDASTSKQVATTEGKGGVNGIWGASEDDVWLGRSEGLGHLAGGKYEDVDSTPTFDIHGTAKDDVWAVVQNGVRHYDGSSWKSVTFPGTGTSDGPQTVTALSKDEVVVTTRSNVYRYDGSTFVKDARSGAPSSAAAVGHIGKNEAWFASSTAIGRLAPASKK